MSARLQNSNTCEMGHHAPCPSSQTKRVSPVQLLKYSNVLGLIFLSETLPQKNPRNIRESVSFRKVLQS